MKKEGSLLLSDYTAEIVATDVLDPNDFNSVLQGLYGEVGGIMATAKKNVREGAAYPGFRKAAEEEFGDTLWYFAAICRRLQISLEDIFKEAANHGNFRNVGAASDVIEGALAYIAVPVDPTTSLDSSLVRLGQAAAALLGNTPVPADLISFARAYLDAMYAAKLAFSEVARGNLRKARGAFLYPQVEDLVGLDFDSEFGVEEQLPRNFKIRVNQRGSGKSYLQWNEVFIGDPLTDNIADPDGYRFHDVFHFAYAAILHWSPVTRALIKHKRKSNPRYDEEQDSGRAMVVEEGLSAWIFSRAKELNFFESQDKVSLEFLKTIGEFVVGYEVEKCPLKLWEKAILDGYAVFRQLKTNKGGWIIGNREERTITYMPLESEK
ncbi:nucleoside triphosphate pyrophosphohydrolase family protein [Pseudomonas sp. St316]|uniref:nucleoside triphosphate pyrophosphohydrolase family protein n=1 Tax=Pseudomonas sp. St316 TaxID=2678257 RepID=UPI001BB3B473|nr:nucleoside triphosphate pyrophosphohydrolase family protein [Pseudomonas sp. St316]BBP56518.1 pyrophosphatase [Pseudomonas sp. St316]